VKFGAADEASLRNAKFYLPAGTVQQRPVAACFRGTN
jgi:hypothetical protein